MKDDETLEEVQVRLEKISATVGMMDVKVAVMECLYELTKANQIQPHASKAIEKAMDAIISKGR